LNDLLRNPEAEALFENLSAYSDVAEVFLSSLKGLGESGCRGNCGEYPAPYVETAGVVFCAAAGMSETYWRLRPDGIRIAIATGAEPAAVGPDWVRISLFQCGWPKPVLARWVPRAYDFALTGC